MWFDILDGVTIAPLTIAVFLKELVNSKSQLFCVGDDWQSIYGFRGSVIDYIVNFKEHFNNPEIIQYFNVKVNSKLQLRF